MTAAEKREAQASQMHPKLYALGQNGIVRALSSLFWTPKALKAAKKHRLPTPRTSRTYSAYTPARTPKMVVVHVHEGAVVRF